jgi:hypothetical protein
MEEKPYEDGYKNGVAFAEYHFSMWQDDQGPPFPWPRMASDVREFIEDCLPMMNLAFSARMAQDAREAGLDPEYLPIPRALIKGVEDGYRARLTELLNEFVRRRSMRGY